MKRQVLFLVLSLFAGSIFGQDIIVDFAATGASTTVETVNVVNLNNGTSIQVVGTESLNLTNYISTGIQSFENLTVKTLETYPNPFSNFTNINFLVKESGNVKVSVFDLSGQIVTEHTAKMTEGIHSYEFTASNSGVYFISVAGKNMIETSKVMSTGSSSSKIMLSYKGITSNQYVKTSSKAVAPFVFAEGNTIKLTAVSGNYSNIITDAPTMSKTYSFVYEEPLARTLYVTDAITGKLFSKSLTLEPVKASLVELPVSCGLHPLSVNVINDRVVISDAGANIAWSAWGTDADGRIFSVNLLGEDEYTITSGSDLNGSGSEYVNDPFASCLDADGNVYWVDRFDGVRKMNYIEKEAAYPVAPDALFATYSTVDNGDVSTYGWTDGGVKVVEGDLWYSKHGSGQGLYKMSTVDGSFISKIDALYEYKIRAFDVDLVNSKIYLVINMTSGALEPGLYVSDLDGTNIMLIDDFKEGGLDIVLSTEGGADEPVSITSVVVDNESGYVYFPFRHAEDIDATGVVIGDGSLSGIKRYKLDQTTPTPAEWYLTGVIPYGIGLNYTLGE